MTDFFLLLSTQNENLRHWFFTLIFSLFVQSVRNMRVKNPTSCIDVKRDDMDTEASKWCMFSFQTALLTKLEEVYGFMTEWMFCMFSNATADVRYEEMKGKSCVHFEDKSLKHKVINSVCFRTKYRPKGHDSVSFIQREHHLLLMQMQNTRSHFNWWSVHKETIR